MEKMTDPSFTLEHEKHTWRVAITQDGKEYAVSLTTFGTGKMTVTPWQSHYEIFNFLNSSPDTVLAIGRLLIAAARKAGAMDA